MSRTTWDSECAVNERQLLQCVVEVARSAFRAEASSVFLIDTDTDELVFEAVAGRGADHLVGTRFSGGTGIAGWVAACGQPLLADDLAETQFDQSAAEETGYVPRTVAAAPLYRDGECIGVLEVLDRSLDRDELETLDLLGLLSSQAAVGIELLQRLRASARRPGATMPSSRTMIENITNDLSGLDGDQAVLLSQVLALAATVSGSGRPHP
jgi:GAF domain-containing protein